MAVTGWSTSNYFSRSGAVVASTPLTMACWINYSSVSVSGWALSLGNNGASGFFGLQVAGATVGDPIRAQVQSDGGTSGIADSASGYTINIWQHIAGVFASTTSRTSYLNGVGGTPETTSVTDPTPDFTTIGNLRRSTPSTSIPAASLVAEVCFWNAALTDGEIASLAAGASPLIIRPASLVAYYPGFDATTPMPEWMQASELTMTGTITTATDHPPVFRYSDDHGIFVPAAGGVTAYPWHHYQQMMAG